MQNGNNKKHNKNVPFNARNYAWRVEDKVLWEKVAKSVRPLRASTVIISNDELADFKTLLDQAETVNKKNASVKKTVIADSYQAKATKANSNGLSQPINSIDYKTQRKIALGKLAIHRRLDLHGLTQGEAHSILLRFLQSAQFQGLRHVLIITGKGKSPQSDGVLRQLVPQWLSTPPFRNFVSAIDNAARHHGGEGAIYLKLRKLNRP